MTPIMNLRCYLIALIGISFAATAFTQGTTPPDFTAGTLLDSVHTAADPAQSYALYLPKSWLSDQAFPVLYFFEPAARGKLPVEKYKGVADSHGLILVGSHNSRNGSWEVCIEAANAMFEDTWDRLKLDSSQVYASGFSGGARVATAIAMETGKLNGVIGCGAGFPDLPNWQPTESRKFPFVGIVGRLDMNWVEMHDAEAVLTEREVPNRLIVHEGPHQWPDAKLMAQAVDFLFVETMGPDSEKLDREWAVARRGERVEIAKAYVAAEEPYLAYYQWKNLSDDFSWIGTDQTLFPYEESFRKEVETEANARAEEQPLRDEITRHFLFNLDNYRDSATFAWWELKGKSLTRQRHSKDKAEAAMAERLTRMVAARALESPFPLTDYPKTISFYKVWSLVEPETVWPHYRLAVAYAGAKEDNLAVSSLKKAIKNGLKKKQRLTDPPEFQRLSKKKKFVKLMEGLE